MVESSICCPKKTATFPWMGVANMRGPNRQTRRCSYPLPSVDDILVKQGAKQIFSILDLRQAFHQQPLHPDSRHITCTHTPFGIYQWRVNVMGLKNAGIQFQMMMDDRLQSVRDTADAYIDDIIVGTRVEEGEDLFEAHDRDLRRVLQLLREEKLVADIGKCKFFVPEVEFCGHILRNGSRRPAPGKLSAIENWEVPRSITELRAFLGFANYYSSYIEGYSGIVAGLQDKLKVPREEGKKGSKKRISWTPEDQQAFQEIKKRLCSGLVLQRVNPDKPFVLRVDASGYAAGACLEQLLDEARKPTPEDVIQRKTVPVAFMSRKLTQTQKNWVPREQETYAIILALQKWESWIGLQPILVLTDHKALEYWTHEVLDTPSGPLGRRSRWHQILSKYDLTVGYIPGKENTMADVLSRWAYPASQVLRDISLHGSEKDDEEMKCLMRKEKDTERACIYIVLKDPPMEKNNWVRGVKKKPGVGEASNPSPPLRFSFKRPQGRRPPVEMHEEITPLVSPPRRRAGEGTGEEISDGEEVSSEITEPFENEDRGEPLAEGGGERALPSLDPSQQATSSNQAVDPIGVPGSVGPLPRQLTVSEMETCNWCGEYQKCTRWVKEWDNVHDDVENWPKGFQLVDNRLYFEGKLCVPKYLQAAHVRAYHDFYLHPGPERLWKKLCVLFEFADREEAKAFTDVMMSQCESCQACQRSQRLKGPIVHTPIPPGVMESVAIDVFRMPEVGVENRNFDAIVACVDRHSGWIVAIPVQYKGLSGAEVARSMLKYMWRPFGIPSVITSDQGSHFVNAWWQTMCAKLGIRQAFSQAYHHQANGRAEMAGQQIMEKLRKMNANEAINWVEALPLVLDRYHDVPGESGYSPYQILFGRERSLGQLPYRLPTESEDAVAFFARMEEVDHQVAELLNAKHSAIAERVNAGRKEPPSFDIGEEVMYLRPPDSGGKLDTRWLGPAKVVAKRGEHSYDVRLEPGRIVHATFLKKHQTDVFSGNPTPLYYHRRTVPETQSRVAE